MVEKAPKFFENSRKNWPRLIIVTNGATHPILLYQSVGKAYKIIPSFLRFLIQPRHLFPSVHLQGKNLCEAVNGDTLRLKLRTGADFCIFEGLNLSCVVFLLIN